MSRGNHETEIKLAMANAPSARRLLHAAGFRVFRRRVFESNHVFDTPGLALRKGRTLLRIREAGGHAKLTFKGVPIAGKHKSREELELDISSGHTMSLVLDRLGYQPKFRYEKYRTEFRAPGGSGVATLDETPIGTFMELEGPARWIDHTARTLGFHETDYITASYAALYLAWCREHGVTPTHMVFK